jgi:hypothetical protein
VHTTVSTASGTCHIVTAICRYRGRVGTGLSVLWVAYATVDTVVCAPDYGWKYHPKHVEQFPDINKLCNVASFDMDMSYTRVLHITVAYRASHN